MSPMSPDPCDAREAEQCPCPASRLLNQLIRSLATANGRSTNAERTAWGLPTTGPDTTTMPGSTRIHEGHP